MNPKLRETLSATIEARLLGTKVEAPELPAWVGTFDSPEGDLAELPVWSSLVL